ncbi:MAG TPA: hypothetical protein VI489_05060 [Candidatus Brocadiaceae bacterium]
MEVKINVDDKDRDAVLGLANRLVTAIEQIARFPDKFEVVISLKEKEKKP